jgi:hypothetical protein
MNRLLRLFASAAALLLKPPGSDATPRQSGPPPVDGFDPRAKLTFEETVAQMQRGYENTQRMVQAMDAKAGAVVALCLAILAFTGTLVAWIHDNLGDGILQAVSAPHCCLAWTLVLLILAVGASGFACLDRSFKTVRPHGLPEPRHFTTLFPAAEKAWANPEAIRHLGRVAAGESREFVLQEFQQQLLAMGGIVYLKIKHLRQAIRCLWWQGLFAMTLALVIGTAAGFGVLPRKSDENKPQRAIVLPPADGP